MRKRDNELKQFHHYQQKNTLEFSTIRHLKIFLDKRRICPEDIERYFPYRVIETISL